MADFESPQSLTENPGVRCSQGMDAKNLPDAHQGLAAEAHACDAVITLEEAALLIVESRLRAVSARLCQLRAWAAAEGIVVAVDHEPPRTKASGSVSALLINRNLVTVPEFARQLKMAESSVFNLLKLGLPSVKQPGIGRRILRDEAIAWLKGGGATRCRKAKDKARDVAANRGGRNG